MQQELGGICNSAAPFDKRIHYQPNGKPVNGLDGLRNTAHQDKKSV